MDKKDIEEGETGEELESYMILKAAFTIFLFAWFLNFAWESFHGPFLYRMGEMIGITTPQGFVPLIAWVSVKDALLVLVLYGATALVLREKLWKEGAGVREMCTLGLLGVLTAAGIEYHALSTGRWAYSQLMPTVLGIGVSPLLQLGATGIIAVIVADWIRK